MSRKLQHISGVPVVGDPLVVPGENSDEHAAHFSKAAQYVVTAALPNLAACNPVAAANPPQHFAWLGKDLPPKLQYVSGVPAAGDPLEVPGESSDEHAAPFCKVVQAVGTTALPNLATCNPVAAVSPPQHLAWQATRDPRDFGDRDYEDCLRHCRLHAPAHDEPGPDNCTQCPLLPSVKVVVAGVAPRSAGASSLHGVGHSLAQIEHSVSQPADCKCLAAILTAFGSASPDFADQALVKHSVGQQADRLLSKLWLSIDAQADRAKLVALDAQYVRLERSKRAKVALLVAFRGWRVVAGASGSKPRRSRGKRGKMHLGRR